MTKKINKIAKINIIDNDNDNLKEIVLEKSNRMQNIIRNTILSIKTNKNNDIFSNNDTILSISILTDLFEKVSLVSNEKHTNKKEQLDNLRKISEKLFMIADTHCHLKTEIALYVNKKDCVLLSISRL